MKLGFLYDSCGSALGGQVTKNQEVVRFFESQGDELDMCDVYGLGKRRIFELWKVLKEFVDRNNKIVLILDANNFVYIIVLLFFLKKKIRIFYIVIGGNMHVCLQKKPIARMCCSAIYKTYVETKKNKHEMEDVGLSNVSVLPNCCEIVEFEKTEYFMKTNEPLRLCTFSRICKEKGIDIAIDVIENVNRKLGCEAYKLDVYGPIDGTYKEHFEKKVEGNKQCIRYKGCLERNKAPWILKEYLCMLFLTCHEGEGFPGAVLDAFMAGLPVIASDINALPEVIDNGRTGYIIHKPYIDELSEKLIEVYNNPDTIMRMRDNCLKEAKKYDAAVVLKTLRDDMMEVENEN